MRLAHLVGRISRLPRPLPSVVAGAAILFPFIVVAAIVALVRLPSDPKQAAMILTMCALLLVAAAVGGFAHGVLWPLSRVPYTGRWLRWVVAVFIYQATIIVVAARFDEKIRDVAASPIYWVAFLIVAAILGAFASAAANALPALPNIPPETGRQSQGEERRRGA